MVEARVDRQAEERVPAGSDFHEDLRAPWRHELSKVRLRAFFALPLLALIVLGGRAEACPLTNPNCVVKEVDKTAKDTVEDVQDAADDAQEDATEAADEVVDDVDQTIDDVQETVDDTLNPGGGPTTPPPPPPEEDPTDPPPGEVGPSGTRIQGAGEERRQRELDRRARSEGEGREEAVGPARIEPPAGTAAFLGPATDISREDDRSLGESAIEAAKDFAFPLLLTLLVGAFLAVQHRVDRREPKLVLAPVEHEFLSFK